MHLYDALAILTVLAAIFSYLNYRFFRLPDTIGVMLLSTLASLAVVAAGRLQPALFAGATRFVGSIDFYTVVVKMMLGFLLFAGAIHVDANELRRLRVPILTFSTLSVVLSTVIVGVLFYYLCAIVLQPLAFV